MKQRLTKRVGRFALVVLAFAVGLVSYRLIGYRIVDVLRDPLRCGEVLFDVISQVGTVLDLECVPILVTNVDGTPRALVALSPTGSGAPVVFNGRARTLESPHGEVYGLVGEYLSGPSDQDLVSCRVQQANGKIRVSLPASRSGEDVLAHCRSAGRPVPEISPP